MEQQNNNDEIDLLEVFNNLLKSTYFFFNRWYKTMAIITLLGFVLGVLAYFKDKDKYQNNMVGTSPLIQSTIIVDIINSLGNINRSDKESFQEIMDLSVQDAENIATFSADTIETLKNHITTIKVELIYSDSIDVRNFTEKLVNYINNNEYVKREINIEKRKNNALIEKTNYEISKLDSLQQNILKSSVKSTKVNPGGLLISNDQINKFFHDDMIKLENSKQSYLAKMDRLTGFEIINRFEPAKIKERSLFKTVAIFAGIALGLSFFVLLGFEIRRKAIQLINRNK